MFTSPHSRVCKMHESVQLLELHEYFLNISLPLFLKGIRCMIKARPVSTQGENDGRMIRTCRPQIGCRLLESSSDKGWGMTLKG